MVNQTQISPGTLRIIKTVDRFAMFVGRHWLASFVLVYGAWVLVPFTAPFLMHAGLTGPGDAIYFFYSFFCHQLPERSFFLYGPKLMYSLDEIGRVWSTENAAVLRQFVGNDQMGWKMAWSDRMISTYGGVWLGALIYAVLSLFRRVPRVSIKFWILVGCLPLALDGFSHMANDLVAGTTGAGFRDTNDWLRALTLNLFPGSFYYGDALGSFNSLARWFTGILFGIVTALAIFPIVGEAMHDMASQSADQFNRVLAREHQSTVAPSNSRLNDEGL